MQTASRAKTCYCRFPAAWCNSVASHYQRALYILQSFAGHELFEVRHRAIITIAQRLEAGILAASQLTAHAALFVSQLDAVDIAELLSHGENVTAADVASHYQRALYILQSLADTTDLQRHLASVEAFAARTADPALQDAAALVSQGVVRGPLRSAAEQHTGPSRDRISAATTASLRARQRASNTADGSAAVAVAAAPAPHTAIAAAARQLTTSMESAVSALQQRRSVPVPLFEAGCSAAATVLAHLLPSTTAPAAVAANAHMAAVSTADSGWCFPYVCLTRQDEQRLVDLLLAFKAVAAGDAGSMHPPEPQSNPATRPYQLFTDTYLRDFPAEVFLSFPQLLSHLTAPLLTATQPPAAPGSAAADADAPQQQAVLSAAVQALTALLTGIHSALTRLVEGQHNAAVSTGPTGTSGTTREEQLAAAAATTLARHESRAAVRDYALGRNKETTAEDHHYGSSAGGSAASSLPADSRYAPFSDVAVRSGWHFLPHVTSALQAQVSHYYGQRYRYPPAAVSSHVHIHPGVPAVDAAAAVVSGVPAALPSWQQDGQALLDAPIAVSRFAAVVAEAALASCAHPSRVSLMLPLLRLALPLATDPVLIAPQAVGTFTGDAAAALQRCTDTAASSLAALAVHLRASGGSITSRSSLDAPSDVQSAVISYARLFNAMPAHLHGLLDVVVTQLLLAVPRDVLAADASAETPQSTQRPALLSRLTDADRDKIRRAAFARSSCRIQLPTALLTALAGALCCPAIAEGHAHWQPALPALLERFIGPVEHARRIGVRIAADTTCLRKGLRAAAMAATAANTEPLEQQLLLAWQAFVATFPADSNHSLSQRVCAAILHWHGSSEGQSGAVDNLCALVTSAAAEITAGAFESTQSPEQLLAALLQHPMPHVRVSAYQAVHRVLQQGLTGECVLSLLCGQATVLRLCLLSGLIDSHSAVVAAAAHVISTACAIAVSQPGAVNAAVKECVTACLPPEAALSTVTTAAEDRAVPSETVQALNHMSASIKTLIIDPDAPIVPCDWLLSHVRLLFSPEPAARCTAAVALSETVNENMRNAAALPATAADEERAALVASAWHTVGSDARTDPVVALSQAYSSGDRLPLYPVATVAPLLAAVSPVWQPVAPAAIASAVVTAAGDAAMTRYESAVAFAGSQLGHLEASLSAPHLPLHLRTSAAEQIAHALLFTAPVPADIQHRCVTTARTALAAARALHESAAPAPARVSGSPRKTGSTASAEDDVIAKQRAVAAMLVLLEAASAVSGPVRAALRGDESALLLFIELLWLGPIVRTQTAGTSGGSTAALHMIDARLVAARVLARLAFEAVAPAADGDDEEGRITSAYAEQLPFRRAPSSQGDAQLPPWQGPAAEVCVHAVVYNSLPLLRCTAVAAGPATLLPCPTVQPSLTVPVDMAQPTAITAYLLDLGRSKKAAAGNQRRIALEAEASALVAEAQAAGSYEQFTEAVLRLLAACNADTGMAAAVAKCRSASAAPSADGVDGDGDGDEAAGTGAATGLLTAFSRFLEVPPSTAADQLAVATLLQLIQALMPHLTASDVLNLSALLRDRWLPQLAATDKEQQSADAIVASHLKHLEGEVTATGSGTAQGRAQLLVDALRPSVYETVCQPFAVRVGSSSSAAAVSATALVQLSDEAQHSIWQDSPFVSARVTLMCNILMTTAALCGLGSDAGAAAACMVAEQDSGISHVLGLLLHPHAAAAVQGHVLQVLLALAQHPQALDTLLGLPAPDEAVLPQTLPPPHPSASKLSQVTRALIRLATSHRSLDSFQHKANVRLAAAALVRIAHYGLALQDRAPAHAALALEPAVWTDRYSGTFGWLQRLAVDRESIVRSCAYALFAALLRASPACYSRMESDPALSDLLSTTLRHATTTVVANVATAEAASGTHAVVQMTAHTDLEDAETPAVRAACADALAAFVTAARAESARTRGAMSAPHIADRLFAVDAATRFRLALRGLGAGGPPQAHVGPLLRALAACADASTGSSSTGLLHTVLADAAARDGLAAAASYGVLEQQCQVAARLLQRAGVSLQEEQHTGSWMTATADATSNSGPALQALLAARAGAFAVMRKYLLAQHGGTEAEEADSVLPLRLRRHHAHPFILAALHTIVERKTGKTADEACSEACLLLGSVLKAWERGASGNYPLFELTGTDGSEEAVSEAAATPSGGSPGRVSSSTKATVHSGAISAARFLLSRLFPSLAAILLHREAPLALHISAAFAVNAISTSLSLVAAAGVRLHTDALGAGCLLTLQDGCSLPAAAVAARALTGLVLRIGRSSGGDSVDGIAGVDTLPDTAVAVAAASLDASVVSGGAGQSPWLQPRQPAVPPQGLFAASVSTVHAASIVEEPAIAAPHSIYTLGSLPTGSAVLTGGSSSGAAKARRVRVATSAAAPAPRRATKAVASRYMRPHNQLLASTGYGGGISTAAVDHTLNTTAAATTGAGPAPAVPSTGGMLYTSYAAETLLFVRAGVVRSLFHALPAYVLGSGAASFPVSQLSSQVRDILLPGSPRQQHDTAARASKSKSKVALPSVTAAESEALAAFTVTSTYAEAVASADAARAAVAAGAAALLECAFILPGGACLGAVAASGLLHETASGHVYAARLVTALDDAATNLQLAMGGAATASLPPVQALLAAGAGAAEVVALSRVLAATVIAHSQGGDAACTISAAATDLPSCLSRALSAAAALLRFADSAPKPDTILAAGVQLAVGVLEVVTNLCSNGEEAAALVAAAATAGTAATGRASSLLDIVIAESAIACDIAIAPNTSRSPTVASTAGGVSTAAAVGLLRGLVEPAPHRASPATAAHIMRLHDMLYTTLMAAAAQSTTCRQLILSRGLPVSVAGMLWKRLTSAGVAAGTVGDGVTAAVTVTVAALLALPLPAMASAVRLLSAVAMPGDDPACLSLIRAPHVVDTAVAGLQMQLSAAAAAASTAPALAQSLAEFRIACATLLANLATRKGNDDYFLSRSGMLESVVVATCDATVGVRAAAAATVWQLARATVRVRSELVSRGLESTLRDATAQTAMLTTKLQRGASTGADNAGNLEAAQLLQQAQARLDDVLQQLEERKEQEGGKGLTGKAKRPSIRPPTLPSARRSTLSTSSRAINDAADS